MLSLKDYVEIHSLSGTNFISSFSQQRLIDLKSCTEFKHVKNFNVISPKDSFYTKNASDFYRIPLKTDTVFNSRINIVSIDISVNPIPATDAKILPDGFSTTVEKKNDDTICTLFYRFDIQKVLDENKFLSKEEAKRHIVSEICKRINDVLSEEKYCRYYRCIYLTVHKDSIKEKGDGELVKTSVLLSEIYDNAEKLVPFCDAQ